MEIVISIELIIYIAEIISCNFVIFKYDNIVKINNKILIDHFLMIYYFTETSDWNLLTCKRPTITSLRKWPPINWSVNFSKKSHTKPGSRISPISAYTRVSCIWLPCRTCTRWRLLVGTWGHTCGLAWCWTH